MLCTVALLYADVAQSTGLAQVLEPEELDALLGAMRRCAVDVLERAGGTLVRAQNDEVVAIFGYPQAAEDSGRRAIEAALDLHAAVSAMLLPVALPAGCHLDLHTGVHSGRVLVAPGDLLRGRIDLNGVAPAIAQRLSKAAGARGILASLEALGRSDGAFLTGGAVELEIAGIGRPVRAVQVIARAPGGRQVAASRRTFAPLVGRDAEHGLLLGMLEGRGPDTLVVSGPAGIGKSRLLAEFAAEARERGARVLLGNSDGGLDARPMQPVLQILRQVCNVAFEATPEITRIAVQDTLAQIDERLQHGIDTIVAALAPPAGRSPPAPDRLGPLLAAVCAGLARLGPLVLALDDWHWADDASRDIVGALHRARLPCALVLATRAGESALTAFDGARALALEPLTEDQALRTVGHLLPDADPFQAHAVWRRTGGLPLYIEALCLQLRSGMPRSPDVGGREQPVTAWLNQLVETRLSQLAPSAVALVRAAAVIGNQMPAWLLARVAGADPSPAALDVLEREDFLFADGAGATLQFKHGLTREAVYATIKLQQRRELHQRVADALRRQAAAQGGAPAHEALAHHCAAAGDVVGAADHAEQAADQAARLSALDQAQRLYRAALQALDAQAPSQEVTRRWVRISQRLALVCVFDASRDDLPLFESAMQRAEALGEPALVARSRYWLGFIHYSLGHVRTAIGHVARARAEAQDAGEPALAVQALATLGQAHTTAADYRIALPMLDESIAIKRRHHESGRLAVGLAFALVCRAWILGDRGDFRAAHAAFEEAEHCLGGELHQIGSTISGWQAAVLLWQGRWAEARVRAAESARIAASTRSLYQLAIARALEAHAQWRLTGRPETLDAIADAAQWVRRPQSGLFLSLMHGWLALGQAQTGQWGPLRRYAAEALARSRQSDLLGAAMAYRALALADAGRGDTAAGQRYLARAMHVAAVRESAHEAAVTDLQAADWLALRGDRPAALERLDRAEAAFERMAMDWHGAQAAVLRRTLSDRA